MDVEFRLLPRWAAVVSRAAAMPGSIKFGVDFELDVRAYELRSAGIPLKLEPIPLELLLFLVERRGELVTREQIVERVWGKDVFLDTDNSINGAISKIRQVLRDDAEHAQFVQTVTGRGYRFVAPIIEVSLPVVGGPGGAAQVLLPESLIGKKISHYRVLQLLGGGGMGIVYRAEDLKLGRRVAMKFLPGDLASDPTAFDRMQREARAASSLDHPNICAVYELGEHEGQPFIVMQLLEGQTLREWIETAASQRSPVAIEDVLNLAIQIAGGLEAAHQKGIIHRDIKPANIFVTSRGEAKILDFGVAKFVDTLEPANAPQDAGTGAPATENAETRVSDPHLTRTGVSIGTPSYLSPEQVRREKLDARTDLYSFGLVLYEMVTGQRAFSGNTSAVIRDAVLHSPVVPPRQLNPRVPPELEKVIDKALEKDRTRRYGSAGEMQDDLEKLRPGSKAAGSHWLPIAVGLAVVAAAFWIAVSTGVLFRKPNQLESGSTVKTRRSVAVIGFNNLSGKADEAWISTALSEMLCAELAAGQQLRVIPGESVARMKLDLSLAAADSYGQDTLNKIRSHLGADFVVVGSYLADGKDSGGRVHLDLQLQDAKQGETVAVISQEGTEAELANLVSQGGAGLRRKLALSAVSASDAREVQASIPANSEAARLYSEGLARLRAFEPLAARDLLQKAIAADPTHALSHSALAESWSALGYDLKAREEAKQAFDLSGSLSRADRLSVEGRYRELTHDFPAAIEIYLTLRNFFADDLDYGLRLTAAQLEAGRGKDASETIARMRSLPPPEGSDARIDLMETNVSEALSDFRRMQQVAAAAGEKGRLQSSHSIVAQAREREGEAWDSLGDYDRAMTLLSEARALFEEGGNPRDSASALREIAEVQFEKGDYPTARMSFEQALRVFRQTGAQHEVAYTLSGLGSLLYDHGLLEEAKRSLEEALRVDREIGNGTERDLTNLGNVVEALGDLDAAILMRQQAAQGFHQQGDKSNEAMALTNLGGVLLHRGEINSAKQNVERAMALQQQVGHKKGLGFSLFFMAEILRTQDQLEEARATAERNIALRKELRDEAHIPETQMQLAEIALEQGKVAEAESLVRAAAASFDKQNVTDLGAQAYSDLARALLAQGNLREAKETADHAMELSKKGGDLTADFDATLALAAVDTALGKTTKATKDLENLRAETSRHRYAGYEMEARLGLAELQLRAGEVTLGREHLRQLQQDARDNGFLLLSRKASAAK
jgi:serine/threonine protein kinase/tetratricopeptide (TPR) repeat protein/DNA-binding winged helix-turn-helix (wHTH) protein